MTSTKITSQQSKAFIIIMLIAAVFGYWFAKQQIHALAPDALTSYPKIYFYITAFKTLVTILLFFSVSAFLLPYLSRQKLGLAWVAASYLPLLLVYLHLSFGAIFLLIIFMQLSGLLLVWRANDYSWLKDRYLIDVCALVFLFTLHLIFTTEFSPLHWKVALFTMRPEEITPESPLYISYALAKQFAFSTMDYSEWAGIMNPPITLASPFLQLLAVILDLPSLNPLSFHILVSAVNFTLIVGGSFGCYLFLKYAGKLKSVFALFGGVLMFFSVSPYLRIEMENDGGVFFSSFATLPYCLLMISMACEKKSYLLAAWTGVAMTAQFFLMTPHPEGVMYTVLYTAMYSAGLILFSPYANFLQRILLTIVAFVAFTLLSAYVVVPIFIDQFTGLMHTFAHRDIAANQPLDWHYVQIFNALIPLSILFIWRRKIYPTLLPLLFFCICAYYLLVLTTDINFVNAAINTFHVGVHLWIPWRMSLFVTLSILMVGMVCMDAIGRILMRIAHFQYVVYQHTISLQGY